MSDVTAMLQQSDAGNAGAASQIFPLVYQELRRLAAAKLAGERQDHTLEPTALVHEAYLRLAGPQRFQNRAHFFAAAAEAMRRILVEHARRQKAAKHGAGQQPVSLELDPVAQPMPGPDPEQLLDIHAALDNFEAAHPLKAQLVKLRFFAGLTGDEAAEALGIASATADNHWAYARAWLRAHIDGQKNR